MGNAATDETTPSISPQEGKLYDYDLHQKADRLADLVRALRRDECPTPETSRNRLRAVWRDGYPPLKRHPNHRRLDCLSAKELQTTTK